MSQKQFPLWVSHSSMKDFLDCPRAYYLRQIYKNPAGNKINIVNPSLALGSVVHDTLDSISTLKAEDRFKESLIEKYHELWKNFSGELGGFTNESEEQYFKNRGLNMIQRAIDNPGPLLNKAVKLKSPDNLPPRYFISEEENILLCGKVDWLEYFPKDNSVHIIDFKTGIKDEKSDSLQLPIYALLVKNLQKRNIKKISYWYLERENKPTEMQIPDFDEAYKRVMEIALKVKELRRIGEYVCPRNGCYTCKPLENIVNGDAKFVRHSGYQDIYAII